VRLTRALIVTLVLMVSPVAAAACEIVCGLPSHGPSHAAQTPAPAMPSVDAHAHHGHHAPPPVAASDPSSDPSSASLTAPDCDLTPASPARLRTSFADSTTNIAAITTPTVAWAGPTQTSRFPVLVAPSPPGPPPHAPVPLRI